MPEFYHYGLHNAIKMRSDAYQELLSKSDLPSDKTILNHDLIIQDLRRKLNFSFYNFQ